MAPEHSTRARGGRTIPRDDGDEERRVVRDVRAMLFPAFAQPHDEAP